MKINNLKYKLKTFSIKFFLLVGIVFSTNFAYNYAQENYNTISNRTECSTIKKYNPSYGDKLGCDAINLLNATASIGKTLKNLHD